MARFGARFISRVSVVVAYSFLASSDTHAVTTSWNTNSSGNFTTAANWTSGVPDSDDTAVFNRGFVAYEVNFPGGLIFDPPVNYPIDSLRVRTNEVSFLYTASPFATIPRLSVLNPDMSIVVGENDGDVSILNMAIASLSGANASIGQAFDANGTLNVGGTFSISGTLNIGDSGYGIMNVTAGGRVESFDCNLGHFVSGQGQAIISGAGSTWANSGNLILGDVGLGFLDITDGGTVSSNTATIGTAGFGLFTGGVATVTGAGSTWTISNALYIGPGFGYGTLTIRNGGSVSSTDGLIGDGDGSDLSGGYALVTGTGSTWTMARLSIGSAFGGIGLLDIEPGGTVLVAQGILIFPEGRIRLQGGNLAAIAVSFQGGGEFDWTSGTLQVDTFNGDLLNQGGTLLPGSANLTTIAGNYTQQSAGAMEFAIGGTSPVTDFNQVMVDDIATLGGTLDVSLRGDFTPSAGDMFEIITATGGRAGMFAMEILPTLAGNLDWNVIYGANSVTLEVVAPGVPGDYNNNGTVDAADYVLWRKGGPLANEVDTPGTVNAADYTVWRSRFGNPAGSGAGSSANAPVPEPATLVLLTLATVGWCLGRHRAA